MIEIRFYGPLEKWAGNRTIRGEGTTIREVLESVDKQIGKSLLRHLLDEKGRVKAQFHILHNGIDIDSLDGLEQEVKNGDIITCVPPIGGG